MNTNTDPRNNPLLREIERVSPATSLTLGVGQYDEDGWEIMYIFAVGSIVTNTRGDALRIMGFTLDDLVICQPYGLGSDPAIKTILYRAAGLVIVPEAEEGLAHVNGLISFFG